MNHQEVFSESVKKNFAYLVNEFGFSVVEDQYDKSSYSCIIVFQNKLRRVKLIWELKDSMFYFYVCKVSNSKKLALFRDESVDEFIIPALARHYESQIDIRELTNMNYYNPDLKVLDERVGNNANLLRKYGKEILSGNEWFNWKKKKVVSDKK